MRSLLAHQSQAAGYPEHLQLSQWTRTCVDSRCHSSCACACPSAVDCRVIIDSSSSKPTAAMRRMHGGRSVGCGWQKTRRLSNCCVLPTGDTLLEAPTPPGSAPCVTVSDTASPPSGQPTAARSRLVFTQHSCEQDRCATPVTRGSSNMQRQLRTALYLEYRERCGEG